MNTEQKTFDFTGVNAESNAQLIKDLQMSIANIKPNGNYHVDIPREIIKNIAAIQQRLELYQGFNDYQKLPENEIYPRSICFISLKDATAIPIDSDGSPEILDADEVVCLINNAIEDEETFVKIGCSTINVNNVWMVHDTENNKQIIINEDNDPQITPISKETIPQMDSNNLTETIDVLLEWISAINDEDEKFGNDVELLNQAIDELEERFLNERYEKERISNILYAFVDRYKLYHLFEQNVEIIKEEQKDPEDTFRVGEELYGDMDQFMKEYPWLRADWAKQ